MEEDKLGFDGSPEGIRQLASKAAGTAIKKKNQRSAAAKHFGVPEEQVDEQMVSMYEAMKEAGV